MSLTVIEEDKNGLGALDNFCQNSEKPAATYQNFHLSVRFTAELQLVAKSIILKLQTLTFESEL